MKKNNYIDIPNLLINRLTRFTHTLKTIFKNKIIIYFMGMLVGILISLLTLTLFINIKSQEVENFIQPKILQKQKLENFVIDNKDYIIAGLLLNSDNQPIFENIIREKNISTEKIINYLNINIFPIYKEAIKQYLSTYSLGDIFPKITNFLKTKLGNIDFSKLTSILKSKIMTFLKTHSDFFEDVLINGINNFLEIVKSSLVKVYNDNKAQIINIIKSTSTDKINELLSKYGETLKENIVNLTVEKIKEYLPIVKNELIEEIKTSDFYIKLTKIITNLKNLISNLNNLFADTDDDYHFGVVQINDQIINLSFLNFLDLYINLNTVKYDNNNSKFNTSDDTLTISDIYINFESLDENGIDLLLGKIQVSGSIAFLLYSSLGVINETI